MKFLITEDKRKELAFQLIDDYFTKTFGGLEAVSNEEDFYEEIYFYPKDWDNDTEHIFYKNFYGILWPEDCDTWYYLLKLLKSMSFDTQDSRKIICEYFSKKFEVKIKGSNAESCWEPDSDW